MIDSRYPIQNMYPQLPSLLLNICSIFLISEMLPLNIKWNVQIRICGRRTSGTLTQENSMHDLRKVWFVTILYKTESSCGYGHITCKACGKSLCFLLLVFSVCRRSRLDICGYRRCLLEWSARFSAVRNRTIRSGYVLVVWSKHYPRVRDVVQAISRRLLTAASRFQCQSGHMGFVVDKVALRHVFSPSTSVSPANYYSTDRSTLIIIIIIIRVWYSKPNTCRSNKWTQSHLTPRN
jgi:hypothetical protein